MSTPWAASNPATKEKEDGMLRSTFVALVALGLTVGHLAAQGKIDCGVTYKAYWDKFQQETGGASIAADELANVSRLALRAYDACQAGDESLFDELAKSAR
jgi:hypothetical protein